MNKTLAEAMVFAEGWRRSCRASTSDTAFRHSALYRARAGQGRRLPTTRVKVGAQNMHWADAGAWTGEVSPVMLRDCGLDVVELGHSERREHFGETDRTVGPEDGSGGAGTASCR